MIRIQVSTSSGGTNPYTIEPGPAEVDFAQSQDISEISTLDGTNVYQESTWDGRKRTLTWYRVGADSTTKPSLYDFYHTARSHWMGQIRYFNFGTLSTLADTFPTANNWRKCRCVDLVATPEKGSALRYSKLELIIQPEQ